MVRDLSKITKPVLVVIALICLVISVELTVVYFNANFNQSASPSFCSINEVIDCDSVAQTSFARILEVPLSVWGIGFYSFILGILLFPFNKFELFKEFKHPKSYVFLLAFFSVIVSVILAYISSFVIQKICILCHALYFLNVLLFLVCLVGNSIMDLLKNVLNDLINIFSDKRWIIIAVISVLTGLSLLVVINIYKPFTPEDISNKYDYPYTIGEIGNTLGSKNAKLVIREFTDYECPFCAISNRTLIRLASEFKEIRVEHYDYPLNAECNSQVKHTIHKKACIASYYARAAKKQGKFWDMATLLFDNQEVLSEKKILQLAKSIDLDIEQLKKDAHDPELKKEIEKDIKRAASFGINGTPSYIIGIKKHEGLMRYNEFKEKIEESLPSR